MQLLRNATILALLIFVSHSIFAQVGIGVTNPQYMTDIRGEIRLRYDSINNLFPAIYFNKINNELGASITMSNDSVLSFKPEPFTPFGSSQTAVVMDVKKGFLGLQKESGQFGRPALLGPKYPLHVRMSDSIGLFLDRPGSLLSASPGTGTGILAKNGLFYTGAIRFINTSNSDAALRFYAGGAATIADLRERLSILGNGFVGINQPNPAARLHVVASDSTLSILENQTSLGTDIKSQLLWKTGDYFTAAMGTKGYGVNTAAFFISTYASVNSSILRERFTILDNGNVGIGTNNPTTLLDVNGTFRLRNGASNGAILTSDASGNATWGSLPAAKGFSVNVSTLQAFSGTAYRAIRFLNTEYAQGINFTDSLMTAATAGLYNFSFTINNAGYTIPGASNSDIVSFRIITSTGQMRYFAYPVRAISNGQVYFTGTTDISLAAGETAKLEVATSVAGSSITINPALNLFSGHLIR